MKCLHLCNDLLGSKVHRNLYHHLADLGVEQTVFYPVRPHTVEKIKTFQETSNLNVIRSIPLKNWHRIFFRLKIRTLYKSLTSQTDVHRFNFSHATTLFSDGALALRLYKEFKIPYVVTVRSTDISVYLRRRPDLQSLGLEILEKATKVIYISNSLKTKFEGHSLINQHLDKFVHKSEIIYNGIDDYWIDNVRSQNKGGGHKMKILYVGILAKQKNIEKLIASVLLLNQQNVECELNIVGSGGDDEANIKNLAGENPGTINYMGAIADRETLRNVYRDNHIFAMPAKTETFGLVYIEALTQAVPVLYIKNESIDGVFDISVGERCPGIEISQIADSLKSLIANYSSYDFSTIDFTIFRWKSISKAYLELYRQLPRTDL